MGAKVEGQGCYLIVELVKLDHHRLIQKADFEVLLAWYIDCVTCLCIFHVHDALCNVVNRFGHISMTSGLAYWFLFLVALMGDQNSYFT